MNTYPEHEKLSKIVERSQAIGEFLEWARDRGWDMYHYREMDPAQDPWGHRRDPRKTLVPVPGPFTDWLAEFFGIDTDALEAEKRAMLEQMRRQQP